MSIPGGWSWSHGSELWARSVPAWPQEELASALWLLRGCSLELCMCRDDTDPSPAACLAHKASVTLPPGLLSCRVTVLVL